MKKQLLGRVAMILLRIWVGIVFIMEGFEKFESLDRFGDRHSPFLDFYRAMGETGYMLPFLGVSEILGGLLIATQRFSLFGTIITIPMALNVFMAHLMLIQSPRGIAYTLTINLVLLLFLYMDRKKIIGLFKA